jgi:hypothetical protein
MLSFSTNACKWVKIEKKAVISTSNNKLPFDYIDVLLIPKLSINCIFRNQIIGYENGATD